ncbi:MAG: antitoxin AF2212-like protein [Gemmataceae bacterium]
MLEIDAVYENGVLKLDRPLPLQEHQHVRLTIQVKTSRIRQSAGLIRWKGSAEELERFAMDPEFGIEESP